jgi:NodT family efflux transporter outer membrane factor (OMF) lipoprotein
MTRATVALISALLAFGCASVPKVSEPDLDVATPDQWTGASLAEGRVDPTWWESFGSPQLNHTIETALERNWDLRAALARVKQAEAQARLAGADLKPQLSAALDGSRSKRNFIGLPIPGAPPGSVLSTTSTTLGLSLAVSWEIDLWGRLGARAGAGVADLQAAQSDLAGAHLSLAGQVAKTWFAAAEAAQQVELARAQVASFQTTVKQVRGRYEMGLRPALDLRLALANLEGGEASLRAREEQLDIVVRQLEILLGRYPGRQVEAPEALPDTPPAVPGELPSDLVARRPDLAAAERRLAAAGARLTAARKDLYPRLSLTASGGTTSAELKDLVSGDFGVWSLAGNLLQPIFQGGRLRAAVTLAEGTADERLAGYASAALGAYLEVETTLRAETLLAEREAHLAEAARQSRAAERLADERYRAGLEGFVTVLESQRRAFQAESEWLVARQLRLANRVDLFLALGGGFERDEETGGPKNGRNGRGQVLHFASEPRPGGGETTRPDPDEMTESEKESAR